MNAPMHLTIADRAMAPRVVIAVLAHNEERRIGLCLSSLPLNDPDVRIHVLVNGSRDRTAAIARAIPTGNVTVHDWAEGGKARSWNRFMFDTPGVDGDVFMFVDGDAEVMPGSIVALLEAILLNPEANAASGLPFNGRNGLNYRGELIASRGLFGDLYALSGDFVRRLRASGVRLPEDLIGDDSLIGALAKTGLASEDDWQEARVVPCHAAGFLLDPVALTSRSGLAKQVARMVNYSVRHFQNQIISELMRGPGPGGLPARMAELYPAWLGRLKPRRHPVWWWFDRRALARMKRAAAKG